VGNVSVLNPREANKCENKFGYLELLHNKTCSSHLLGSLGVRTLTFPSPSSYSSLLSSTRTRENTTKTVRMLQYKSHSSLLNKSTCSSHHTNHTLAAYSLRLHSRQERVNHCSSLLLIALFPMDEP
jgi:hypothetical protein